MRAYAPLPDLLAGRVVLVTGAARGIGRAAARAFAAHGASVVLLDHAQRPLDVLYDEIEQAGHPQPAIVTLDLATATVEDYEAAASKIGQAFGRLDGLLHNAAELGALAPIELYDLGLWARVFSVNLHAPLLLTRACLPWLKRSADASVVFTSADVGRRGRAYWGAYGVACAALEGLTQILAAELEAGGRIRVNSLDPGPVRTALRAQAYPGEDARALPAPEEILSVYLYLLGPDSRGVTGRALCAPARDWGLGNGV